jgi:hypothetical protein
LIFLGALVFKGERAMRCGIRRNLSPFLVFFRAALDRARL